MAKIMKHKMVRTVWPLSLKASKHLDKKIIETVWLENYPFVKWQEGIVLVTV